MDNERQLNRRAIFDSTLEKLDQSFPKIASKIGSPRMVPKHRHFVFRYERKGYPEAIIQKLARVVSGLGAARVLLEHGFFQELYAIQRTLDEFGQDIFFLSMPLTGEPESKLHKDYLHAFFAEEFEDGVDPVNAKQKRASPPRRKIRAAIANSANAAGNPSASVELFRTIEKTFSGFVHAASPQVMDLYGGMPARFHLRGMLGTPRVEEAEDSIANYFFRGLCDQILVAILFGCDDEEKFLRTELEKYEELGIA